MGREQWNNEVTTYVDKTRFAVLAYVREDGTPQLRSMGSFVPDGLKLYFSTRKDAAKVGEIGKQERITFFFEHEGQELNQWQNVHLAGPAARVEEGEEYRRAVQLLSERNPRFKERVEKGELPNIQLFRLDTEEVEFLDYGKGFGHVEKVTLRKSETV
ncbi:pyridoxamine 5'-phosphate oxidase family protein [Geomesophilobacter sediminis]|uniref:Pyridoxamine 5'-phosphate oxidase family protein n=1 Tax=Geomesophilobacter sediminis TaxID=2798584 RepID=A0A8J7LUZ7_9BACT|nr:pyridoxamine 5'-phosphate oxidase family protein [Geomesophilobacter sediminis]MBJ6724345.1 pyridoxamine 5'-phosphate oxidase family protein [Geomesophilobacter sediminis]